MAVAPQYPFNSVTIRTSDGPVSWDLAIRETHTVDLDLDVHKLDEVMPGAPLLGLTSRVGPPENASQPIYSMMRKRQFPRFINLGGAYTAAAGVLNLAAGDENKFKRGYLVLNTLTRVLFQCNGTVANSLPVAVIGEVADADSVSTDDELLILGYRGAEFDTAFVDYVRMPDIIFNYVGSYMTGYQLTDIEEASSHQRGWDPLAVLRADKLEELRLNIETGILFDQRTKGTRADADGVTRAFWLTGGADSFLTLNESDVSTGLTEPVLNSIFRSIRRHGPSERWALSAPRCLEALGNLYVGDRRQNTPIPTEAGIDITSIKYGGLRVNFFEHPLFDDSTSTNVNALNRSCWVFDLDDFGLVTLPGPKTGFFKWFMNVQNNNVMGRQDLLRADVGVRMALPEHHARLIGW